MVHMFPIFSIYYFLLFSYVFLHLRLRSQSFFNLLPYMCIIISILFLQIQYPLSDFNHTPIRLASHFEPTKTPQEYLLESISYAALRLRNHHLSLLKGYGSESLSSSTLRLRFCWKSVFSAAPPASPDLLLCSSSRKCHLSFIPSRVFSLPPVRSWLLKM